MSQNHILINRYQLEERIGSGGMAVVYRAHDLQLERMVAIKVLREDFTRDAAFRDRFRQEAKAAANLSHPNIVTVHDFGLDSGRLFIVMEHVPGLDLKIILLRQSRLDLEAALELMIQACAGVGYAHRAGLVHCDIKPQNLLVTPDQRLKVVDFGIARALASIQPDEQEEIVWGSPLYFSPEQAAGNAPSPASDVYSLGVILYEMVTGSLPFTAETSTELARKHRLEPVRPPRELNAAIPVALEQILFKVLAKEPAARYRTADQFGRVLTTFLEQIRSGQVTSPPPRPSRLPEKSPSRWSPRHSLGNPVLAGHEPNQGNSALEIKDLENSSASRPAVENPLDFDWVTIGLGLLALILVGGLVPFFLWVYFAFNPPLP
ncbi:MAG TPA: protein kinase [Anaerolineales bacterium]|nr:protein kinase [Anaerolineales bacterium]